MEKTQIEIENNGWALTEENFGPLLPYIKDDSITDIDWDNTGLWVVDENGNEKHIHNPKINEVFVDNFIDYVANHESKPFNRNEKVLLSDTETLRITCVHQALVTSGNCFSIRKSLPDLRFTAYEAVRNHYCDEDVLHLIANCIKIRMNINIMGEPGSGKTECAKFFSSFIAPEDKVITVEDSKEWHYSQINPGKRCLEMKVSSPEEYEEAIKVALRLNPKWLMISEARSREVLYYIEGLSTGVHGISTLHTDDVRKAPDRMVIMAGDGASDNLEDTIYTYLQVGILMRQERNEKGLKQRKIKQMCFYYRHHGKNECALIVDNGVLYKERVPEVIIESFRSEGIEDIFYSEEFEKRKERDKAKSLRS